MTDTKARVISLSAFKDKRVGEVGVIQLVETLTAVIEANLEPRLAAAVAPLQQEIEKLRTSLTAVSQQIESVRLGNAQEAGLVLTDDPNASVTLATAKVAHEERYPFSTIDLANQIPGKPSTGRVATVIDELGLKGDARYWCALKVGATGFNRYSNVARERVLAAFNDPQKHLPAESAALRTVMNFLEGI